MMTAREVCDIWDMVNFPDSYLNTMWAEQLVTGFNQGIIPNEIKAWLNEVGYPWPMTEEQEVEFKLRFL